MTVPFGQKTVAALLIVTACSAHTWAADQAAVGAHATPFTAIKPASEPDHGWHKPVCAVAPQACSPGAHADGLDPVLYHAAGDPAWPGLKPQRATTTAVKTVGLRTTGGHANDAKTLDDAVSFCEPVNR